MEASIDPKPDSLTPLSERRVGTKGMPRADRERLLLDIAERAFSDRGYASASMSEIAERAGVTKTMVHAYFGTKEGLFVACARRARHRLYDRLAQAADRAEHPQDQLHECLLELFSFFEAERGAWTVLFAEAGHNDRVGNELARMRSANARLITQLMSDATIERWGFSPPAEALELLAHALVGACDMVARWWLDHPEVSREQVARRLLEFSWLGLGQLLDGRTLPD